MDSEILQALSRTTGPTCLVLLFCLWLLLRRTIMVRFWWMLLAWVLAWVTVPLLVCVSTMAVMIATIPLGWLARSLGIEIWPGIGLLDFPAWFTALTTGLTLGLWAFLLRSWTPKLPGRQRLALALMVVALTAPGPVAFFAPVMARARDKGIQTVQCRVNLDSIGLGLQMYREDHEGTFPERLADLVPDYIYIASDDRLRCPAENEFYFYVPPRSNDPPADRPLVIDANHRNAITIVFADGSVRTFGMGEPILTQQHKKK